VQSAVDAARSRGVDDACHEASRDRVLSLELPYPPSANAYWRNIVLRTGPKCEECGQHTSVQPRVLVSKEAREYRKCVERMYPRLPLLGPVSYTAHAYRPQRRGDLSNLLKVTEDVLQGIAFENDAQVEELHWYRHEDKHRPRLEIEVRHIPDPLFDQVRPA